MDLGFGLVVLGLVLLLGLSLARFGQKRLL